MAAATTNSDMTAVRSATEKVLASNLFRAAPALSKLLSYLSESHGERLSEYAIAIDGLGRRSDFDPAAESTVRVQIKRLRERLDAFYADEGKDETVRVHIPLGGHQLALRAHETPPASLVIAEGPKVTQLATKGIGSRLWSRPRTYAIISTAVAAVIGLWAFRTVSTRRSEIRTAELTGVWRDVFHDNRTTRIIIPSPVFFAWKSATGDRLMVRDTEVNDYSDLEKSGKLAALSSHLGKPELAQAYTAAPDTFASLKLIQYLNHHAVEVAASPDGDPLTVSQTGENVILMGTSRTLASYSMYFKDLGFVMDSASGTVTNLKPSTQETKTYPVVQESPERKLSPAIVAVLPLPGSKARMLIVLSSFDTTGVIEFLTSSAGLAELESSRAKAKAGDYFASIVETETKGDANVRSSVVAVHDLSANR